MDEATKGLLLEALERENALILEQGAGSGQGSHKARLRQAARRLAHDEQLEHGPRWSSRDWLGATTPAEQVAAGRLLKRVEAAGLIVVRRLGGQAQNVKLTEAGHRAVSVDPPKPKKEKRP